MNTKLTRRAAIAGAFAASAALAVPALAAVVSAGAHHRSRFAPMPQSREEWQRVYYRQMTDARLAPRVCPGELLIFDPLAVPEVGGIVLVTFDIGGSTDTLLGILTKLTPKSLALALGLNDQPIRFRRANCAHTIHAAVGVLSPMDTPDSRANAALNAAIRHQDGRA